MNILPRLRCFLRNRHVPVRHPLGGFKCGQCGRAGVDLREMGFDSGSLSPRRKLYSRDPARSGAAWDLERS